MNRVQGSGNRVGRKRWYIASLILLAIVAWFTFRSSEPTHKGVKLSAWLRQFSLTESEASSGEPEVRQAYNVRRAACSEAIRQIGTNAIPYLLALVRDPPPPSPLRDKLQNLLDKQSILRIRLPDPQDTSDQAFDGFEALGSNAVSAIPHLEEHLQKPGTCELAGACLFVIGPASIPSLARAVTNADPRIQHIALMRLGDFGANSCSVVPQLREMSRDPTHPASGKAMRVLSEVSESPVQFLSFFVEHLGDPKRAPDAAFALARLGVEGLHPLLDALTNSQPGIGIAALAGLRWYTQAPDFYAATNAVLGRFRSNSDSFDLQHRRLITPGARAYEPAFIVFALTKLLDQPDSAVRLRALEMLGPYGPDAATGLCKALNDSNETIRRTAEAMIKKLDVVVRKGGIIRGPIGKKKIALIFTGHDFGEGGEIILDQLVRYKAKASFFLTGDFLTNKRFTPFLEQLTPEGHYIGVSSDKNIYYCSQDGLARTLISRDDFSEDVRYVFGKMENWRGPRGAGRQAIYFLPPHDLYNEEIAFWSDDFFMTLIGSTPGTLVHFDATREDEAKFVSSQAILDSIVQREREDPNGLNGFLLLLHVGSGPGRADKFHARFGELLNYLGDKGYEFVRVDQLLEPRPQETR